MRVSNGFRKQFSDGRIDTPTNIKRFQKFAKVGDIREKIDTEYEGNGFAGFDMINQDIRNFIKGRFTIVT